MIQVRRQDLTRASFSILFVALSALILKEKSALLSLAVLGDQTLTYALMPRKTIISLSLSTIPAMLLLLFFILKTPALLVTSAILTIALWSLRMFKSLPDYRPTTDMWVGTLMMMQFVAAMICLI